MYVYSNLRHSDVGWITSVNCPHPYLGVEIVKFYLLLVSIKGGWKVHSVHLTREQAEEWRKCKEHDGEDTAIAEALAEIFSEKLEKKKSLDTYPAPG